MTRTGNTELDVLLQHLRVTSDALIQDAAIYLAGAIADLGDPRAMPVLIDWLTDCSNLVPITSAITWMGDKAVPFLLDTLTNDCQSAFDAQRADRIVSICGCLATINNAAILPHLFSLVQSPSTHPSYLGAPMKAIGRIGGDTAWRFLSDLYYSTTGSRQPSLQSVLHTTALQALSRVGDERSFDLFIECLERPHDQWSYVCGLRGVQTFSGATLHPYLRQALAMQSNDVRFLACLAIGRGRHSTLTSDLLPLLTRYPIDGDEWSSEGEHLGLTVSIVLGSLGEQWDSLRLYHRIPRVNPWLIQQWLHGLVVTNTLLSKEKIREALTLKSSPDTSWYALQTIARLNDSTFLPDVWTLESSPHRTVTGIKLAEVARHVGQKLSVSRL